MDKINISDGEWKLMKLLWESAPRTIGENAAQIARLADMLQKAE